MRTLILSVLLSGFVLGAVHADPAMANQVRQLDCSAIRGANYCAAGGHHLEHWLNYSPAETRRDLGYAKKIGINQVRVFLSYAAYQANPAAFRHNLTDLAHACREMGIGLMPVAMTKSEMFQEPAPHPRAREWVQMLLDTIGREPALACWDAYNEPDYPEDSKLASHVADARVMAELFRQLDSRHPRTPVTIGFAFEKYMEQNADAVDVLSFHDYSPTREQVHDNILAALRFSKQVRMPVVNTEMGCTARANPYDMAIEEYTNAHVGFYIWELMITRYWGNVHGVFYPDGSVRDPSIAAAMLGLFRNRSDHVVPEFPDREGWVSRTVASGRTWLGTPKAPYDDGLRIAEIAANLLEANQLVAMHDLPSRRVLLLRQGAPDPAALRALLSDFLKALEPYERPQH